MLSKEQLEQFYFQVYNKIIDEYRLPEYLYLFTGEKLLEGVFQGYGKTLKEISLASPDYKILKSLHDNVYIFSSAKTFQQVQDTKKVVFDEKGFKRSFNEFRIDAEKINEIYNGYKVPENWLRAEYDTAVSQANSAAYWQEIEKEKDILPVLQFQAVGDDATCPICRPFDNKIRHVDDSFWNYAMPPLHFRCRCLVIQQDDSFKQTLKSELPKEREVSELFRFNPGKQNYIFESKGEAMHPYFKVAERYKLFKDNNFGMKIPKI